jgi:hypothetical protein
MSHSQTVQTRRKRKRAEKDRAAAAKLAKRLRNQTPKKAGAS